MERGYNPLIRPDGKLLNFLCKFREGLRREDPPPKPEHAAPIELIQFVSQQGQMIYAGPHTQAICDLIVIGFFFLLRVGEYTHTRKKGRRRTTQFRLGDVVFEKNGTIIAHNTTSAVLATATSATFTIDNQKNGVRGQVITQHRTGSSICPVQALARRVYTLKKNDAPPTTLISAVFNDKVSQVTDKDIVKTIRMAAATIGLHHRGFDLQRIGSHSLRSGGAMALHMNKWDIVTIKKLGRWSSDTFLMYIQSQITGLTEGVSQSMLRPFPFFNAHGAAQKLSYNNHA